MACRHAAKPSRNNNKLTIAMRGKWLYHASALDRGAMRLLKDICTLTCDNTVHHRFIGPQSGMTPNSPTNLKPSLPFPLAPVASIVARKQLDATRPV